MAAEHAHDLIENGLQTGGFAGRSKDLGIPAVDRVFEYRNERVAPQLLLLQGY
jgi:hypothetical protein